MAFKQRLATADYPVVAWWSDSMAKLILEPTSQAQWLALLHEAESACDRHLDETLESYLVFLLMRFTDKPHCTARIMARDYLESQRLHGELRAERLRDVGDHCLLFSGMFPQLAERRLVRVSYFVDLGRSSYRQLSDVLDRGWATVYQHLSEAFIVLMDILHAMRALDGEGVLTPIQAMDLWSDTGSRRCYQQVSAEGRALPVPFTDEIH
ncbi:MAG: hypothetical protein PVJ66_08435 [Gammaproteobacteria bacterium]|jgi:hypothetical protein